MAKLVFSVLALAFLAACRGSSLTNLTPPVRQNAFPAGILLTTLTAKFTVAVPASATSAKSISISANGAAPVIHNVGPTVAGCVAATGGKPLTCTVSVTAKTGTNTFSIKTFSANNGTGTVLATGMLLQALTASTTIPVTLAATASSITLSLLNTAPVECNPATVTPLFVAVRDAAGELIVAKSYGTTIMLHDSDTSAATALSATSATSSAAAITLAYNGHLLKSATISATATGISAANVHNAMLTPSQMVYVLDSSRS